jgi:hypothetical protein
MAKPGGTATGIAIDRDRAELLSWRRLLSVHPAPPWWWISPEMPTLSQGRSLADHLHDQRQILNRLVKVQDTSAAVTAAVPGVPMGCGLVGIHLRRSSRKPSGQQELPGLDRGPQLGISTACGAGRPKAACPALDRSVTDCYSLVNTA